MSTEKATGDAFGIYERSIPIPSLPYFVINEMLTYDPDGDDDMTWGLYYEALTEDVSFQVSTSANQSGQNNYVESDVHIVQFQHPTIVGETFVDYRNSGFEDGTMDYPWNTIGEGVEWVFEGGVVMIGDGAYPENITIGRHLTLVNSSSSGIVSIGVVGQRPYPRQIQYRGLPQYDR